MMEKVKEKLKNNNLFFYIICTVAGGIICLVTALCVINVKLSQEVFLASFEESQQKIFNQIDTEFFSFYRDMTDILGEVCSNESIRKYMTEKYEDQIDERRCIISAKKLIEQSSFSNYSDCNMLFVSVKGKTYIYNQSSVLLPDAAEILDMPISKNVLKNPKLMASQHMDRGFVNTMKNSSVVVFAKAIVEPGSGAAEGIVYVTMRETDFQKMYTYFTSDTSDILIFNQDKELLSSNNSSYFSKEKGETAKQILTKMEEAGIERMTEKKGGEIASYQIQRFENTNYKLLGIMNPEAAFEEEYDFKSVLLITLFIAAVVAMMLWYFVRKQIKPLYQLVGVMSKVREGHLQEYVDTGGTAEIQQLSHTYNDMMKEINQYVDKIYRVESEKRMAEIHALQMQINPHYIYNTLTSIKWLVWQGEKDKACKVIEAFIILLRNTISNTDEFITVGQEIENLKNYVLINQVRYGEAVKVEFFVAMGCEDYKVPKLMLQPFVENAFFHAFPEGRGGVIHVFVRKNKDKIQFEIKDSGVGIAREKLLSLKQKGEQKNEHLTGIGVNNVDNRIKMIYGPDYGVHITSEKERGTTVTVVIPAADV